MDATDHVPQTGDQGINLKGQLKDKLVEHKQYIDAHLAKVLDPNWQIAGAVDVDERRVGHRRRRAAGVHRGLQLADRAVVFTAVTSRLSSARPTPIHVSRSMGTRSFAAQFRTVSP